MYLTVIHQLSVGMGGGGGEGMEYFPYTAMVCQVSSTWLYLKMHSPSKRSKRITKKVKKETHTHTHTHQVKSFFFRYTLIKPL